AAKFQIFSALFHAGEGYAFHSDPMLSTTMYALLVIGGINTVISAVYYLKVVKVMILETTLEDGEGREPQPLPAPMPSVLYAGLLAVLLFAAGIQWQRLADDSREGVEPFRHLSSQEATLKAGGGPS